MKRIGLWLLCGWIYWYVVGQHFLEVHEAGRPIITFVWGCWGLWPLSWALPAIRRARRIRRSNRETLDAIADFKRPW